MAMDIDTTLARHDRGRMPTHEYVILKDLLASMIDSDDEDRLDSTSSDDGSSSDDSIFDSSDSSDEDLLIDALLAHEAATKQRRVEYPRAHRIREPWVTFNPAEFERLTEFAPRYVLDMCTQMERMPRVVVTPSRCKASLELAMTIVLLRFTGEDTTRPWSQIASILRSCETYLIAIFQQTGFLLALHYEILATCLDVLYLQPRLRQFAEVVRDTGALVWPTVLTLDGKTWRSCRPHRSFNDYDNDIDFQMAVYDGHHACHGLCSHDVLFPNGISVTGIGSASGHDQQHLTNMNIIDALECLYVDGNPDLPALGFGDQAYYGYPSNRIIAQPRGILSKRRHDFYKTMRTMRATSEQNFGIQSRLFPYLNHRRQMKLMRACTLTMKDLLIMRTLIVNCHVCCYGSQVTGTFKLAPPTLEEYFANANMDRIPNLN